MNQALYRLTPRIWACTVVVILLFAAVYLFCIPPIVGVADDGDGVRISGPVGLDFPREVTAFNDRYGCWLRTKWTRVPAAPLPHFTTGQIPARIAVNLSRLWNATTFDIRWMAGVHLAFMLGIILALLRSVRELPRAAFLIVTVGSVLVCTDSGYIAYFNSFYEESAAFLGLLAFVAVGLAAATAGKLSGRHLLAITLAAGFFAGSKSQNTVLGLVAAGWLVLLFRNDRLRYAAAAAGLALACFSGFLVKRAPSAPANLFHAIYFQVLEHSSDPRASLIELGLKPETIVWKGKFFWDAHPDATDMYPGKASVLKLMVYYLRHLVVTFRIARDSLILSNDVGYLGNYTKESGASCLQRTRAFTGYDRLRSQLASVWFVFPLLAANIAAVCIWRNRIAGLISILAVMAVIAFAIGSLYDTGPHKHLFTFNLLFDVLMFADLAAAGAVPARALGRGRLGIHS